MFARCARVAPACMRTPSPSPYFTARFLSSCTTLTPLFSDRVRVPFAPLIVTSSGVTVAVTPCGSGTGALATLLMGWASGHDAQDFAALADGAGLLVRHDALGRRHDDGTHAAEHFGQL